VEAFVLLTAKLLQDIIEVAAEGGHLGVVGAEGGLANGQGPLVLAAGAGASRFGLVNLREHTCLGVVSSRRYGSRTRHTLLKYGCLAVNGLDGAIKEWWLFEELPPDNARFSTDLRQLPALGHRTR
jgi:hypothetical protein